MKLDTCALAGKRCHCEENRYEMYTYCKRSCGYCGQERLRKYDDCKQNSCISCASGGIEPVAYRTGLTHGRSLRFLINEVRVRVIIRVCSRIRMRNRNERLN